MRKTPRAAFLLTAAAVFSLGLTGCGGGPPLQKAKGQILVNGKHYQVGAREQLLVIFYPDVPTPNTTYPADVKPDGSYETVGVDGRGIPAGKYRVGITSPLGDGNVTIPPELGSPSSPIVREVVQGQETLEPIDIMKPGG
jgi:hypothetical protein